ncbi:MAG: hypothetical protein HUU16_14385 [Candidatus Omnitrophica bacterium]|nr:hypothetical protein [Candidatus Omnitrophota bacterium]
MRIEHKAVVVAVLVAAGMVAAAPAQDQALPIREMLDAFDQAFFSSCTVRLRATLPATAFDLSQGLIDADVVMSADGAEQALFVERHEIANPVFNANEIRRTNDQGENYEVSLEKRSFVLLARDAWSRRADFQTLSITPQSSLAGISVSRPLVEVRPVRHPDAANLFYRYVLQLGRGYSGLLSEVTTVEEQPDGTVRVEGRGTLFSPHVGAWELIVDLTQGCLVTSASFKRDDGAEKSLIGGEDGAEIVGTELPILSKGTFHLAPDYPITVEVQEYTRSASPTLIADVRQAVGSPGGNFTLLDFSNVDGAGAPLVVKGRKAE